MGSKRPDLKRQLKKHKRTLLSRRKKKDKRRRLCLYNKLLKDTAEERAIRRAQREAERAAKISDIQTQEKKDKDSQMDGIQTIPA